jgi:hypothetical protein
LAADDWTPALRAELEERTATRSLSFGPGESMIHDLENTGDAELIFTTVEYLDSPNDPLPLPGDA